MATIKKNILANLVGKIWPVAIAIILIPQYIKFLGIESYGLVGFYATLIGSMAILDLGLSTTINRELAKFRTQNRNEKDVRDLTFSLECIYWCIGIFMCAAVIVLSGFISAHWVRVENLPLTVVRQSIILMGMVLAFQWPISLYEGGLTGLDKQVLNNIIGVVMTTIRGAGVLIVLVYFSATLQAFFIWQAVTSLLYVFVMRLFLWREMPKADRRPSFSKTQLKIIWRFAAGMTGISLVTFFLAQLDKILLSKLLSLSQFGYYTLGFTIATSIQMIVAPVSTTFFPRFVKLIAGEEMGELKKLYHFASRLMGAFIFPVSFFLFSYGYDILRIWTKNDLTTANTYPLMRILILGSMFNALMVIPYNVIIAKGWTRFVIYQNAIAAVMLVPLLFWWTHLYGALGATFGWLIVNAGCLLISQPLLHKWIFKGDLLKWYWNDIILTMLPSLVFILLIKGLGIFFFPEIQMNLFLLGIIFIMTIGISFLAIANMRYFLKEKIANLLLHARGKI